MASHDRYAHAKLIQNEYFEHFEGVDWTVYKSNEIEHQYLKQNIGFALFGPSTENNALGYTKKQAQNICEIYTTMCNNHYLENNDELHVRFIFICLSFESDNMEDVVTIPLFVIKKCSKIFEYDRLGHCTIFIDNSNRVYNDWNLYLTNNKLPKCTMICPKNGKYSGRIYLNSEGEETVEVELEYHDSPAYGLDKKILNVTDTVGTGVSVATGVTIAISAIPAVTLAPGILIAAGIGGIGAGLYSVGRSIHNLVDRKRHQQTISLTNAESRNCWLNATVGVVSAGASGATAALTAVTRNGAAVGNATKIAFNTLSFANLVGSTTNCGVTVFNFIEKLVKKSQITAMDVYQLSSSILFFQMSVVNFKTANAIIQETQTSVISQYEASLRSNRHRKVFNKAKLEATRLNGEAAGNAEIIKGIQNIANRDQFFAGIVKINKNLNKMGAKYTINADGKVVINSVSIIDPIEFNQMNVMDRQVSLTALPASTPGASRGITETQLELKVAQIKSFCVNKIVTVVPRIVLNICENSESIASLLHDFCQNTADCILDISIKFLDEIGGELEPIKKMHPMVNTTILGIQFVIEYIKRYATLIHSEVTTVINTFFLDLPRYISNLVQSFTNWWNSKKESYFSIPNVYININTKQKDRVVCKSCQGHYFRSKF